MKKSSRGLSTVVSVMILVLLVIVAVGIVAVVVNNIINRNINQTDNCGLKSLNKITLDKRYTCFYNRTAEDSITGCPSTPCVDIPGSIDVCMNPGVNGYCIHITGFQYISVSMGNVEVDKLIVTLTDDRGSKNYEIIDGVVKGDILNYIPGDLYGGAPNQPPLILKKNEGHTYFTALNMLPTENEKPKSVKIRPVIGGNTCEVADEIREIGFCNPDDGFPDIIP
ncbi:hypothetical protein J4229_03890 [Candidatus Pacearchaeota archaeon]|nr:hypothetical protein [Candidatus Pacearchaeota archaeon]